MLKISFFSSQILTFFNKAFIPETPAHKTFTDGKNLFIHFLNLLVR